MIDVKMQFGKKAFNRRPVTEAADRAETRVLFKVGAFVRTVARRSMRRGRRVSQPGQPPVSHVGLIKTLMRFDVDRQRGEVVIGPARLNKQPLVDGRTVPNLMEFGGTVRGGGVFYMQQNNTGDWATQLKNGKYVIRVDQPMDYQPRPFMGPALEIAKPEYPKLWANSVTR